MTLKDKTILLIISGGIAAYKSLELIRLMRKDGAHVRAIITKGGEQFVTPLSVSALCEHEAHTDLWSLKDETEMGHIRLSREADAIVIAPASADILAKMATGQASDLASTTLLAADKHALIAPAMNHQMWNNPATQRNIETLKQDGHQFIGPTEGAMACNETGLGRMSEPEDIFAAITDFFLSSPQNQPNATKGRDGATAAIRQSIPGEEGSIREAEGAILKGYTATITSGPTYEALDPVRFIGNRSSGKQGHAIAQALQQAGAEVTLITGPVAIPDPACVNTIHIESAAQMLEATTNTLPADIAICAAAVSDWSAANEQGHKIKKRAGDEPPAITLKENPDILKTISNHAKRPRLVIGFAAETQDLLPNAKSKLKRKGCDWILANEVGGVDNTRGESGGTPVRENSRKVFGEDENHVYLVSQDQEEQEWPRCSKTEIAEKLVQAIIKHFEIEENTNTNATIAAE